MVSKEALHAVALTLLIVGATTALVGTRTMWGNEDRTCTDDGQAVACTDAQTDAMEMVTNDMGDLIFGYALVLGLAGLGIGIFAMRRRDPNAES